MCIRDSYYIVILQPQLALSVEFLSEILYVGAPILNYMENFYVLIIQWLYVKKV